MGVGKVSESIDELKKKNEEAKRIMAEIEAWSSDMEFVGSQHVQLRHWSTNTGPKKLSAWQIEHALKPFVQKQIDRLAEELRDLYAPPKPQETPASPCTTDAKDSGIIDTTPIISV